MPSSTKSCISALLLVVFLPAIAAAFHDGGVAYCAGCHSMHNTQDGYTPYHQSPNGRPFLLKYGNASDTCLMCHSFYGQFMNGRGHGPGGDFYWVSRTFNWTQHSGSTATSTGDSHGHNVVTNVFHLAPDATLSAAPGGDFLGNLLSCTSCHDPHGNASFRMLYGSGAGPWYDGDRYSFAHAAPLARGNERLTYAGGGGEETNAQHTVYKSGVSEWCANCHQAFHDPAAGRFIHPTDIALGAAVADVYNAYLSSDDPLGGNQTTSYAGLVPFEAVDVDLTLADPLNATAGPTAGDRVMCLSCHRSHASPFADIGRWDFLATFLNADSHPQLTDGGATATDVANRYYQYTFSNAQRSLCNKCHVKDLGDAPPGP